MIAIGIRRLLPHGSPEALKGMLHRAFASLGGRGWRCAGSELTLCPWPARHPAELALLANGARSKRQMASAHARPVAAVAGAASGAGGADPRRR